MSHRRALSSLMDAAEVADMLTGEELVESLAWNKERENVANVAALEEELRLRKEASDRSDEEYEEHVESVVDQDIEDEIDDDGRESAAEGVRDELRRAD